VALAGKHTGRGRGDGEVGGPVRDQKIFDAIAHFLRTDLFPSRDRFSQNVLLSLYRLLAEGSPVTLASLSVASGADGRAVDRIVGEIAPSRLQFDKAGRIIAFAGLTQRPAKHRFVFRGRELFTWCAFDALFLPELLGGRAEVSCSCPVTDGKISMTVREDGLESNGSSGAVMSFVMPDKDSCRADLRGTFCNHVNFFASYRAAGVWLARNPGAAILSLDDAFALGRIRNDAGFRYALANGEAAPQGFEGKGTA